MVTGRGNRVPCSFGSWGGVLLCVLGLTEVSPVAPHLGVQGTEHSTKETVHLSVNKPEAELQGAQCPRALRPVRVLGPKVDNFWAWGQDRESQEGVLESGDVRIKP